MLNLRVPALGGEVDFAVLPRDSKGHSSTLHTSGIPQGVESKLTGLSGTAASAIRFIRDSRELPSGFPAFDSAYQVLVLPGRVSAAPVDSALAERALHWPADTIAPHSVLAWRDPFGLKFEARLPGQPDWPTVLNFLAFAEDVTARLPAPVASSAPRGLVDRLIARLLGS